MVGCVGAWVPVTFLTIKTKATQLAEYIVPWQEFLAIGLSLYPFLFTAVAGITNKLELQLCV